MRTCVVAVLAILIGAAPAYAQEVPPEVAASRRLREAAATLAPLPDTGSGITRDVGGIAVIEHDGSNYDRETPEGIPNYEPRAAVALRFYQTHPDDYDFLVVFTNFSFDKRNATAFHNMVRNDATGIGLGPVDNGALFGSPGRLKGFVDMAEVGQYAVPPYSMDPAEPGFSRSLGVLPHEIGHQWLARVRFRDGTGALSTALLGRDRSHWSALLDSDASFMYGSDWMPRADGTFLADRVMETYSPLDRYLMGLLEASKVPPMTLLRNTDLDPTALPQEGAVVVADSSTVTMEQILAAEGPRSPGVLHSQKEFRVGFVFLTRPGVDPTAEELAVAETFRSLVAGRFFALTGGTAVLDASLHQIPPLAPEAFPDLDRALDWLVQQQSIDGRWEDRPATVVRDTTAALGALVRQGRGGIGVERGNAWLESAGTTNLDSLARKVDVLAARRSPEQRVALAGQLFAHQNADGGFGAGRGYSSDPLDTALVLQALAALEHGVDSRVRDAVTSLADGRSPAGGWPFVAGGPASTVATAYVLSALHAWSATVPEASSLISAGLPALLARQNADGGFGESPSTPYATALALDVLFRVRAPEAATSPAIEWLRRTQSANGSWSDSRFDTALVVSVLRASTTNLSVPMDSLLVDPPAVAEGETVRVSARVRNTGRTPSPATRARLFDGDPAAGSVVGDVPVGPLEPGAEAPVAFDLATLDRPGTRTLYVVADALGEVAEAREDDNSASRSLRVDGWLPDLRVGPEDISIAPELPAVGEASILEIVVRNPGRRASAPALLRVIVHREGHAPIVLSAPLPVVLSEGWHSVLIPWTPDVAGLASLEIHADAANAIEEEDETNNRVFLSVEIGAAIPEGPDFTVRDVTLEPGVLRRLGDDVHVRARVANRGRTAAATVVALYDGEPTEGGQQVGETTVSPAARSSLEVAFTFRPTRAGTRPVVVVVDPAATVPEADETNNRAEATLVDPRNTLDVEVRSEDVIASTATPRAGESIEVSAVVRNRGTVPTPAVPVLLAHGDGGGRRELGRQTVALQPGESTTVAFTWRVGLLGDPLVLHVVADPFALLAEIDEGNNDAEVALAVQPAGLPNWRVSAADVSLDPDPPREGQPAAVTVNVANTGEVGAPPTRLRVQANDAAAGATTVAEADVPAIPAGGTTTVMATWASVDTRSLSGVTVIIDPDAAVEEFDETDNVAVRLVGAIGLPDLVITAGGIRLEPAFPRAGEPVEAHITVRNLGGQSSAPSQVRLHDGEAGAGDVLGTIDVPALGPGSATEVVITWTPSAVGERLVSFVVDPENTLREADEGNNSVRRSVIVQDVDLYVTAVHFSPDGDGRQDTTTLGYRTTAPVDVLVSDERGQLVRQLATLAPAVGTVEWDGRNDGGALARDGQYTFTLRDAHGVVHGRLTVILDLNRTTLVEAVGTPYVRARNITCALDNYSFSQSWFPGDRALLIVMRPASGAPAALGRLDLSGNFLPLHADEWYAGVRFPSDQSVSPSGQEVLLLRGFELFVVDLVSGERRTVATNVEWAEWSPDGRMIAVNGRVLDTQGALIAELPMGEHVTWSPDGQHLAGTGFGDDVVIASASGEVLHSLEFDHSRVTVAWRPDGTLFVRTFDDLEDDRTLTRGWLVDRASGERTELPWLRDSEIVAVRWSADMTHTVFTRDVVVEDSSNFTTYVGREDGTQPVLLFRGDLRLSPTLAAALIEPSELGRQCRGNRLNDLVAIATLQNLTADIEAERLPANTGIQLRGTVSDQYLEHHQLAYADARQPETWYPIGTASDVPVVDDAFAAWVPPGPGTFLLRLHVRDRAGNQVTLTRSATWDRIPSITNVTATEPLISPNGDGRRDGVTFRYLVLEPTRVEVRIEGPLDEAIGDPSLVRETAFDHAQTGPAEFTWDGRDAPGQVVPDGRYRVLLNELPLHVEVDTTPPDVSWEYANPRPALVPTARGTITALAADLHAVAVDERLRSWRAGPFQGTSALYEPERSEDGLIVYDGTVPRPRRVGGRPVPLELRVSSEFEVLDFATRSGEVATAEDHAGNVSQAAVVPLPERVVVLEGFVVGPGVVHPRVFGPGTTLESVYPLPAGDRTFALLAIAETIAGSPPITLEYRVEPHHPWIEGSTQPGGSGTTTFSFKGLSFPPGTLYGRFVARAGARTIASEEFRFRSCEPLNLVLEAVDLPDGTRVKATVRGTRKLREGRLFIGGNSGRQPFRSEVALRAVTNQPDILLEGQAIVPPSQCGRSLVFEAVVTDETGERITDDPERCIRLRDEQSTNNNCLVQSFAYCEGNPDTVYVAGSLTRPFPSSELYIEHGPAESPVSVVISGGEAILVPIDVTGIPEGKLEMRARLVTPGQPDVIAAHATFVVDRTPLPLDMLAPSEGEVVCAAADRKFEFTLRQREDVLVDTQEIRVPDGTWMPFCNTPGCEPEGGNQIESPFLAAVSGPVTLVVDRPTPTQGPHRLRIRGCDRAGNRTSVERGFFAAGQSTLLSWVRRPLPAFSPNGDGRRDSLFLEFSASAPMRVRVEVRNEAAVGDVVRTMEADVAADVAQTLVWDGRDDAGAQVPDGLYDIRIAPSSNACRLGYLTLAHDVRVDTVPPIAQVVSPVEGQTVGASVDVVGTATDDHFDGYEMGFGSGADPPSFTPFGANRGPVVGGLLGRWAASVASGTYTLRLIARDEAANEGSALVHVNVGPRSLIDGLEVTTLFSPNGDGRRDQATIAYQILQEVRLVTEVRDGSGATVRTLESDVPRGPGTYTLTWTGDADGGGAANDGTYVVVVRAEPLGGGPEQQESAAVILDRTAPTVTVLNPSADAIVPPDRRVVATIEDAHLTVHRVLAVIDGTETLLAEGHNPLTAAELAVLSSLPEGPLRVVVEAEDGAENVTRVEVPVTLDARPPDVSITAPLAGAVLDKVGARAIVGRLTDVSPTEFVLAIGVGADPAAFDELGRGATQGETVTFGSWRDTTFPDGVYTVRVAATDAAGHRAESRVQVTLDGTPPEDAIVAPVAEAALREDTVVTANARDTNLDSWELEAAPEAAGAAFQWTRLASGTENAMGQALVTWALPADGRHVLRLSVRDRAGHVSTSETTVIVDRGPPGTPLDLVARVLPASAGAPDVRLEWTVPSDADVAGYRLRRDGLPLSVPLVAGPPFLDPRVPSGTHTYTVTTVDRAGNESAPASATIRVDADTPVVSIFNPRAGEAVASLVDVLGTATDLTDFAEYRLSVGAGTSPATFTPLRRGTVPVIFGALGTWAPNAEGPHVLLLEATDVSGNRAQVTVAVTVDLQPPAAPVLTSVENVPDAGSLTSTWEPVTDPDLAGYLVYRNGRIATATDILIPDIRALVVPGPSHRDANLRDGTSCYHVVAMDRAGNRSAASNTICRALDNHLPSAAIVQPPDGTRFEFPIRLLAVSPDADIAAVQFEIRPSSGGAWQAIGAPDLAVPFEAVLDPAGLTLGAYGVRAVAREAGGRTDATPTSVTLVYGDTTPPPRPQGLTAVVDGHAVHLEWQPSAATDVAGYRVYVDGQFRNAIPTPTPSYHDHVDLGLWEYRVTAVDSDGNESVPSDGVTAHVYAVSLDRPSYPVTESGTADLVGSGAAEGATVDIQLEGQEAPRASGTAGSDGRFRIEVVPLDVGPNLLRAVGRKGPNRSVPSPYVLFIRNTPPPAVTNLAATADGLSVALSWDATADPEAFGYVLERSGQSLTPSEPAIPASVFASASATEPADAVDGDPETAWIPDGSPAYLGVGFGGPVLVDSIALSFAGFGGPAPLVQYRIAAEWNGQLLTLLDVPDNQATSVVHRLPFPFATSQIRILIDDDTSVGIAELAVHAIPALPASTNLYTDSDVADGRYTYSVAVIDRYGARSPIQTIEVAVGDIDPPAAPTGLSASVAGSVVSLTWSANSEPDVVAYAVVRDGTRVGTSATPSFQDVGVPNGLYRYSVIAVDAVGNESAESPPAAAEVSVTPPAAPLLSGVVTTAGEVDLSWTHPGAASFVVLRSEVSGTSYSEVQRLPDVRSYRDSQAPRGRRQHYVVRALDAAGNASPLSNEVALTPRRSAPPAAPVLLYPTTADRPVTTTLTRVPVIGRAEPGTVVALTDNGLLVGSALTTPDFASETPAIPADAEAPMVSPDGKTVAFAIYDEGFGYRLRWVDVASGTARDVVPTEVGIPWPVRFAPDGRRLAYALWMAGGPRLYVVDLDSGESSLLETDAYDGAWSPDGSAFAVLGTQAGSDALWILDLATGARTILTTQYTAAPRFSPDGSRVAVFELSPSASRMELAVYDRAGAARRADDDVWEGSAPSWSPDGAQVAFTSVSGSQPRVLRFDPVTGEIVDVTDGTRADFGPQWDVAGEWMTFSRFSQGAPTQDLVARRMSTGEERVVGGRPNFYDEPDPPPFHEWLPAGRLAVSTASPIVILSAPGHFEAEDVILQPGLNELVGRAIDAEAASVGAPSRPIHVTVPASQFADLTLGAAGLTTYPRVPLPGQTVTLSVRVQNTGGAEATDVQVRLQVVDESATTVFDRSVTLARVPGGGAVVASASWIPTRSATFLIRASADPSNEVSEPREDDNEASLGVYVSPAASVVVEAETNAREYPSRAPVTLHVRLRNGGPPFAGSLRTTLETPGGARVADVDVRAISLAYAQDLDLTIPWNTGTVEAGEYVLAVRIEGGAATAVPLRIVSDLTVQGRVVPDRASVLLGEPVGFALRVENRGTNERLSGAEARLAIRPAGAGTPAFEATVPLGTILPGGLWESRATWPAASTLGPHGVELSIVRGTATLASATATFAVEPRTPTFAGTLALDRNEVLAGDAAGIQASVTNLAADPRPDVPVSVEVVAGADGRVLARTTQTVSFAGGETALVALTVATLDVPPGRHLAFLRVGAPAATLDRKVLHVHAPITAPSIDTPMDGSRVATDHPMLRVNNASTPDAVALRYEFQLFRDAALSQALPGAAGIAETAARTSWMVGVTLGEDQTYYWRSRATDGFSSSPWTAVASLTVDVVNHVPVAPVPDSPIGGARVASREPLLTVRNADDPELEPLVYEFRIGTDADLANVIASATGIAEGPGTTSWRVPVGLDENGVYHWSARAHDPVQPSAWSPTTRFMVDTVNESPSMPILLRPAPGAEVETVAPELAAQSAIDPEGDAVLHHVEVDRVASFDSPARQVSSALEATAGVVAWTPPVALADNADHYWRVRATDGVTFGGWETGTFFVNLSNDAPSTPVHLDPADGGVVRTLTPSLRVRNATDLDRDALVYEFQVRDAGGALVATAAVPEDAGETAWTVEPALTEDAEYTWSTRASDGALSSPWSDPTRFRVNATVEPPTAPTPVSPPAGALVDDTARPTLVVTNATSPEGLLLSYEFEVYALAADGAGTLVSATAGVPEAASVTSWTVAVDLHDGRHNWRARAFDGTRSGPWSASSEFTIALNQPPAPPAGLEAEPGDGEVRLTWTPSGEGDVVGYRVYRGTVSGGPYAPVGDTATATFVDGGLTNGTTYFYVVTARDDQFESEHSLEVAATPRVGRLVAEVRFRPDQVAAECLVDCARDYCGVDDGAGDDDGDGDDDEPSCPRWLLAAIEPPAGTSPTEIVIASVRLGGSVAPDPTYRPITDGDDDGLAELTLRFPWAAVRPLLAVGANAVRVQGQAGAVEFEGTGSVSVAAPDVDLRISPRTLHGSNGNDVVARLSFRGCLHGHDVDTASLRLNGTVAISRVVSTPGGDLIVKFPRAAVFAALPAGHPVAVHVTGTVHGLAFDSTDHIRVIK